MNLSLNVIVVLSLFPAEACGSKSVYDGPEQEEYSSFVIDDPQETYKTLKQIISSVQTLEQQHTKYKRDKFKKTKIGSQYVVQGQLLTLDSLFFLVTDNTAIKELAH